MTGLASTHLRGAGAVRNATRLAAAGIAIVVLALAVQREPLAALAVPAVIAAMLACRHFPIASLGVLVLLAGMNGALRAFTGISGAAVVDLVLAGFWAALLFEVMSGRRRPAQLMPGAVLLLVFIGVTLVSVLAAETVRAGLESFRVLAWHAAAAPLLAFLAWSGATYDKAARTIVVVAGIVGAYASMRWVIGPAAVELENVDALTGPFNTIAGETAVFGSFTSRLQLAFWVAVMLPFCFACCFAFEGRWRRVSILACASMAIPLIASQGRAALVAVALSLLLILVLGPFSKGLPGARLGVTATAAACAALVGVLAFSVAVGSEEATNRYEEVLSPSGDTAYEVRTQKWELTLNEIEETPFGHGLGTAGVVGLQFQRFVNISLYNVENSYLKIAFEQGVLVLALFIIAATLLLLNLGQRSLWAPDRRSTGIGLGATGTLAAGLAMFMSGEYIDDLTATAMWVIVGLGIGRLGAAAAERTDDRDAGRA